MLALALDVECKAVELNPVAGREVRDGVAIAGVRPDPEEERVLSITTGQRIVAVAAVEQVAAATPVEKIVAAGAGDALGLVRAVEIEALKGIAGSLD